jgi:DNA-binding response OmpR family regulator
MSGLVLLVEDELAIVDFLTRALEQEGHVVVSVGDGVQGEQMALERPFDLVLLDLMLPGKSGLEVLSVLRETKPRLPVIILTARGEVEDRVHGLDAGAVDYLVKPFSVSELMARVRAQLRSASEAAEHVLRSGDLELDLLSRQVTRGEHTIALSTTEFELLSFLLRHRGEVLSRERILQAVWRYEHDPSTNIVDVYIGYLRRKLSGDGSPAPITTVRSVGYRLDDPS